MSNGFRHQCIWTTVYFVQKPWPPPPILPTYKSPKHSVSLSMKCWNIVSSQINVSLTDWLRECSNFIPNILMMILIKFKNDADDGGDGSDVIIVMSCSILPLYHQSLYHQSDPCPITLSPTLSQFWTIVIANYYFFL